LYSDDGRELDTENDSSLLVIIPILQDESRRAWPQAREIWGSFDKNFPEGLKKISLEGRERQ
jgi:hypothetical protein